MKPAAGLPASCHEKWWRLAVARRALVVFSHAPSLDRPNLQKNWQVLRDSHPPGRFWRPTRPLEHLGPDGARGRYRAGSRCLEDSHASLNTSRAKLVERDGYAPSPPHCKCGVLLLSLRPQSGHDGGTRTREPQFCKLVPWLLGHVVLERKTAAQVTRRRKTSPTSVLNDRGLSWWSRRDSHPHRAD